jgi:hypothetical protein
VQAVRAIAVAAVAAATCGAAHATHPLLTEDTGTQGVGGIQVELTGERARDDDILPGVLRSTRPAALLSYGVADTADLQVGASHLRLTLEDGAGTTAAAGLSDVSVDLKWRFLERGPLSLGLKPGVTIPTGEHERGLGSGRWTVGALGILSYEPGPLAFHSHVGYRYNNNLLGERRSLWHFSGAFVLQATERLKLVADLAYDTNPFPSGGRPLVHSVLGAIYGATRDIDLDVGVKLGHSTAAIDLTWLAGLTVRW